MFNNFVEILVDVLVSNLIFFFLIIPYLCSRYKNVLENSRTNVNSFLYFQSALRKSNFQL